MAEIWRSLYSIWRCVRKSLNDSKNRVLVLVSKL